MTRLNVDELIELQGNMLLLYKMQIRRGADIWARSRGLTYGLGVCAQRGADIWARSGCAGMGDDIWARSGCTDKADIWARSGCMGGLIYGLGVGVRVG